jgi:hypothetical protein
MGGPAGVTDADVAGEWIVLQAFFEILEFAFGSPPLKLAAFEGGDAGGVVAAIFEALEGIDQLLRDRAASQNADNPAHAANIPNIVDEFPKQRATVLTKIGGAEKLNNYCRLRQG